MNFKIRLPPLSLTLAIVLSCLNISCSNPELSAKANYQDTLDLLNLSVGGKPLEEFFVEAKIEPMYIYIALDSGYSKWPKKIKNIQIKTITDFNKQPDPIQRAEESRLVINPPKFEFFDDSAKVSIYLFKFHLMKELLFAKKKNEWLLRSDIEHQY